MKLSRLYSNQPDVFPPLQFNDGLNVVLAEIRDPKNLQKDTHNLGKTTVANLIDFCLLKKRNDRVFLIKHKELFKDFVFFLELRLQDRFITLRRDVAEASKISLCYATDSFADLADLPGPQWDHWRVPFDKAKSLLAAQLGFSIAGDWAFRKPLGYALRLQDDYQDVFQLGKFRGAHADWKPFLAQLVGLNGQLVQTAYDLSAKAKELTQEISALEPQLVGLADSPDRLEGMILLRTTEVQALESRLAKFDFRLSDEGISEGLVNEIEASIGRSNERRYHLRMSLKTIDETLGATIRFDLKKVESVFADARVYFGDQLKHDYAALLSFLKSISEERRELLLEERAEIDRELAEIDAALATLNRSRVEALASLREAESVAKYRERTKRLVDLKAALAILERQRQLMEELTDLRNRLSTAKKTRAEIVTAVEANIKTQSTAREGVYRTIRLDFGEVVKSVLDRPAVLSSSLNKDGNIEFQAEILDEAGTTTSADDGHTYRKLLCVAFDIAVFSAYLDEKFLHFVFHDGVFESLDDRKKRCLLNELRERCDSGLQQIITVIASDLPLDEHGARLEFSEHEVIRLLHDEGDQGRLFRMQAW